MLKFNSQHFLTGEELSLKELSALIQQAHHLSQQRNGLNPCSKSNSQVLAGKTIVLSFDKPSLRTRVSFTVGIQELGGQVLVLEGSQKKSEEPEDSIRVLQGMVHGLMLRTFEHSNLERMLPVAKIPIINGLSDLHHPCQALADLLTLKQNFGSLKGLTLAYIGDGNNVLHSLLLLAPFLGVNVNYSCPQSYQPDPEILARAHKRAIQGRAEIKSFQTPAQAAKQAHALYTDVWTSMGQETQSELRKAAFKGYQINQALYDLALPGAVIMHCLPMVRDLEITSQMADHKNSVIFKQAENRLHAQKALLQGIYGGLLKKSGVSLSEEVTYSF